MPARQIRFMSSLIRTRSSGRMPPSRKYAMIAALSLPARKFSSMTRLASADSDPRARNVSLSSAARLWSGPCSGSIATASRSQAPITAQRGMG